MTLVLAIDPGPTTSGFCLYDTVGVVRDSGSRLNNEMLGLITSTHADMLAIERVQSFGMAVGKEVFESCEWIGEFRGLWRARGMTAVLVYRKDVKMHLCGTSRAKDGNVRQAIIDLFPPTGGGKTPQIGTKSLPGPLYGVSSHAWAALGVALTATQRRSG